MSNGRVTSLILAHLGLLAGTDCRHDESVAPTPSPSVSTAALASPLAGSAPLASAPLPAPTVSAAVPSPPSAPSAVASASSPPRSSTMGSLGQACGPSDTCKAGLYCQRNFTGAGFLPGGTCVDHTPIYEGRPLVVDGVVRRAPLEHTGSWSTELPRPRTVGRDAALAAEMTRAALEEHASVAAFARTICELMALGAPESLIAKTSAALGDEVRHAREAFALAAALGADTASPGALGAAVAPLRSGPNLASELLVDVLRGGCVGEALAAARAAARAQSDDSPAQVRAWCTRIAADEARHAALAFETARFLVDHEPTLARIVAAFVRDLDAPARAVVGDVFAAVFGPSEAASA